MRGAYYNEIEPYAAEWLRSLILVGLIAPGDVDTRSIEDVSPEDLRGYTQCHFFAGIGGWSLALRLAGWPDDRPVWTGSCPCQPFSAAGKGLGVADERHLWPAWHWLIQQCRPGVIFGEQVEAAIKHDWLDLVQADLEGVGYSVGAVGLPAAGIGAPHGRARLWFVADAYGGHPGAERLRRSREHRLEPPHSCPSLLADSGCGGSEHPRHHLGESQSAYQGEGHQRQRIWTDARYGGNDGRLADDETGRRSEVDPHEGRRVQRIRAQGRERPNGGSEPCELGDANDARPQGRSLSGAAGERCGAGERAAGAAGVAFWSDCDWLPCRDGKARPVEPGTFPLAHGVPARVGRLRAYGNAIVPQVAAEVIRAYLEYRP